MEINWLILGIVAVGLIILILFTIKKNQKDKKKLTEFLNNDFKRAEEDDLDPDNESER
ncbi:hypothetical protein OIU83_21590 [Flavobacterium sp. LS1R49]|uniref:Uncharacterized protein n=1 Tax=Flavobacterium shii TaxID=2987687 RepID=A0A9X3C041_9FLAO|nr:hypothetical protein [Flavobacterium shii]MCV9930266.1 hypothetical protein [Flavobacterium shii]